jgi:HK97 family phage prohead protease
VKVKQIRFGVKALDSDVDDVDGPGRFEAILSTGRVDRDGEIVDPGAFDPLPKSIPIHVDHRMTVDKLVGRARPYYDGDVLKAEGVFGSDEQSQTVRRKMIDGLIDSMSVGMLRPKMKRVDGVAHVVSGELIEASLVTIPANVDALILAGKTISDDLDPDTICSKVADLLFESDPDLESVEVQISTTTAGGDVRERTATAGGLDVDDSDTDLDLDPAGVRQVGDDLNSADTDPDRPAGSSSDESAGSPDLRADIDKLRSDALAALGHDS